jgi:hypothetical protein
VTAFITVKQGGVEIDDGVYPVVLTAISEPKTVQVTRGPKAGQEMDLLDWTFAIVEGQYADTEITVSSSTASGPKSKMFGFLTALLGGKAPTVGQSFERTDLVGRMALATVRRDESGWPRIENLGAMPASMRNAPGSKAVPVEPVVAPVVVAPAATADLPF